MGMTRLPSVIGVAPSLAAHLATGQTRYGRWLDDIGTPHPDGFDEHLAELIQVARRRQSGHVDGEREHAAFMLSVPIVAAIAGVSPRTIRRHVASGDLVVRRIGRRVVVHPDDLAHWLSS